MNMKTFFEVLKERAEAREAKQKAKRISTIKRLDEKRLKRQQEHQEWEMRTAPDKEEIRKRCEEIRSANATQTEREEWRDEPKLHRNDTPTRDPRKDFRKRSHDGSDCEVIGSIWNGQRVIQCVSETHARVLIDLGF